MKKSNCSSGKYFFATAALLSFSCTASAADSPAEPIDVIHSVYSRHYDLGETSGNAKAMLEVETKAAEEIRRYIASGATDGLLPSKERKRNSALTEAAYLGYPDIVDALLTSDLVKAHINDTEDLGMTPWIAATISMKQSQWTCTPWVFDDPYKFIPLLVIQPYYQSNLMSPYQKTREVLEAAGAQPAPDQAKQFWLKNCKNQSEGIRAKVSAAGDLQKTLLELGASELNAKLSSLPK